MLDARLREHLQGPPAIALRQQRAGVVTGKPGELLFRIHPQPHHEGARLHRRAGRRREHRAAAAGDQLAVGLQQLAQQALFARTEAGLAFQFKDRRHRRAGLVLEPRIGIDEGQSEPARELPAERGLAGAHGADQHEVGRRIHGRDASIPR